MSKGLYVEAIVTTSVAISSFPHDNTDMIGENIIYCSGDGDVVIETVNGVQITRPMTNGQYWKMSPKTIVSTTGSVQLHA